jgi:hypothetical protein
MLLIGLIAETHVFGIHLFPEATTYDTTTIRFIIIMFSNHHVEPLIFLISFESHDCPSSFREKSSLNFLQLIKVLSPLKVFLFPEAKTNYKNFL